MLCFLNWRTPCSSLWRIWLYSFITRRRYNSRYVTEQLSDWWMGGLFTVSLTHSLTHSRTHSIIYCPSYPPTLTLLITIKLEMALFKCVAGTLGNVSMRQFVMRPYFENWLVYYPLSIGLYCINRIKLSMPNLSRKDNSAIPLRFEVSYPRLFYSLFLLMIYQ